MKTITLIEGIAVALAISLAAVPTAMLVSFLMPAIIASKVVVGLTAYSYILYILSKSRSTVGKATFGASALAAFLFAVAYGFHWMPFIILLAGCIWAARSFFFAQGFISAALHGGLCLLGVAGAIWAFSVNRSVFAPVWCFFLIQALWIFIPPCFSKVRISSVEIPSKRKEDRFQRSFRAAETALSEVIRASVH